MTILKVKRILGLGCLVTGLCAVSPAQAQNFRFQFGDSGSTQPGYQPRGHGWSRPGMTNQGSGWDTQGSRGYQYSRPGLQNTPSGGWDQGGYVPRQGYSRPGLSNYPSGGWDDGYTPGNQGRYPSNTGNYYPSHQGHHHHNHGYTQNYTPAPPSYSASNSPIVILGSERAGLSFSLHANGQSWERSVSAGGTYKCTDDREWYIQFHRGGSHGSANYRLKPGIYEFRGTGQGWELFKKTDL